MGSMCEICMKPITEQDKYIQDTSQRIWHENCLELALSHIRVGTLLAIRYLLQAPPSFAPDVANVYKQPQSLIPSVIYLPLEMPVELENINIYRDGGTVSFDIIDCGGWKVEISTDPKRRRLYLGNRLRSTSAKPLSMGCETESVLLQLIKEWLAKQETIDSLHHKGVKIIRSLLESIEERIIVGEN